MKTAIASQSNSETAYIDPHFGKCSYFFIFDDESGKIETIENPGKNHKVCMGQMIVESLVEKKVMRVIAGDFGTHVQKFLNENQIQMIIHPEKQIQIKDILQILSHRPK